MNKTKMKNNIRKQQVVNNKSSTIKRVDLTDTFTEIYIERITSDKELCQNGTYLSGKQGFI